jgi:hypothetical protein
VVEKIIYTKVENTFFRSEIMIDPQQFDQLVIQRLPTLVRQNKQIQELVLELAKENFAERRETEDRFYQLLGELRRDREEQSRKWEEHQREEALKWEEQSRKWEEHQREWKEYTIEQNRRWDETVEEFKRVHQKIDRAIERQNRNFSAIGARWEMKSEKSFRNVLAGILGKNFGVKVLNVVDYDEEGTVFGRPEQVELDVIIKNGLLLICELKSSMDKGGMYLFERKVRFYEKRHQQQANRMIVISPMIEPKAWEIAEKLGIEVYSDFIEVELGDFQDEGV